MPRYAERRAKKITEFSKVLVMESFNELHELRKHEVVQQIADLRMNLDREISRFEASFNTINIRMGLNGPASGVALKVSRGRL